MARLVGKSRLLQIGAWSNLLLLARWDVAWPGHGLPSPAALSHRKQHESSEASSSSVSPVQLDSVRADLVRWAPLILRGLDDFDKEEETMRLQHAVTVLESLSRSIDPTSSILDFRWGGIEWKSLPLIQAVRTSKYLKDASDLQDVMELAVSQIVPGALRAYLRQQLHSKRLVPGDSTTQRCGIILDGAICMHSRAARLFHDSFLYFRVDSSTPSGGRLVAVGSHAIAQDIIAPCTRFASYAGV